MYNVCMNLFLLHHTSATDGRHQGDYTTSTE